MSARRAHLLGSRCNDTRAKKSRIYASGDIRPPPIFMVRAALLAVDPAQARCNDVLVHSWFP